MDRIMMVLMLTFTLRFTNLIGYVTGQNNPYSCTDAKQNYMSNTTMVNNANLTTLLNWLPSNITNYGYHTASLGTAYVAALCRADRTLDQCRQCVGATAPQLLALCPSQTRGVLWDQFCFVRYSNALVHKANARDAVITLRGNLSFRSRNEYFRWHLTRLLLDLRDQAANGGSEVKVGAGSRFMSEVNGSTVYALQQCVPDLLPEDCRRCLANISDQVVDVDNIADGVRMYDPYCIIRYQLNPFYNQTRLNELLPPPQDNSGRKKRINTMKMVVIIVPIGVCVALVACAFIFLRKRIIGPGSQDIKQTINEISSVESLQYELAQIRAATADFHDSNKLGQGGFGAVYKGRLLNGQEIAVKRLSQNSGQGNTEFKNEVLLVAKLQHRNLVRLLGFSLEGVERLLVYEFVQNASLDKFIFDAEKRSDLDWETRYKIICGVARGILYLYEDSRLRIIHRDLKASNVLLDGDMNPKIADFGMARLSRDDEIQGNTTKIVGTYGYMAPEYAMHGEFSIKSDVFSFGVLVLEIISGRRNNVIRRGEYVENLLTIAWENWQRGAVADTIDPLLQNSTSSVSQMVKCIHIGLLCVQENAAIRPTMASCLHMLGASASTLPLPVQPAFYMGTRSDPNAIPIQEPDLGVSVVEIFSPNEISVTELYPR